MLDLPNRAKRIQCLICDVDGVLTDGLLYLDNTGRESRAFNVHDGMGLKLLIAVNIDVAIITTAKNDVVIHRIQQLGIDNYFTGQVDKRSAFAILKSRLKLADDQFAYIGDDLPDLEIIKQVGLGIAVKNAITLVKTHAIWTTQNSGGNGAVREVCDLILAAKDLTETALNQYFIQ